DTQSAGTSRPSLNWSGSSTSNRRHLLLIRRLAISGERNVLFRACRQRFFRHKMFARLERAPREAAEKEPQRPLFGLTIRKRNGHHCLNSSVTNRSRR